MTTARRPLKTEEVMRKILLYTGLAIFLIIYLFPIYWTILTSLKSDIDLWAYPPRFIFKPNFRYYYEIITRGEFFKACLNSFIVSSVSTFFIILFGSLAAYAFSRFNFKGRFFLFSSVISVRAIPYISIVIPLFLIMRELKLVNTYLGLILPYTSLGLALTIWIMSAYFTTIPRELEEAAIIDGCSRWGILFRIILPLSAPGLISVSIIMFMACWNDFLLGVILTGRETRTLPVLIGTARGLLGVEWQRLAALAILGILPGICITLAMQKYVRRGLLLGAIKG